MTCDQCNNLRRSIEALADEEDARIAGVNERMLQRGPEPKTGKPIQMVGILTTKEIRAALAAEPAEATASRPPETSGAGSGAPVAAEEGGERR